MTSPFPYSDVLIKRLRDESNAFADTLTPEEVPAAAIEDDDEQENDAPPAPEPESRTLEAAPSPLPPAPTPVLLPATTTDIPLLKQGPQRVLSSAPSVSEERKVPPVPPVTGAIRVPARPFGSALMRYS